MQDKYLPEGWSQDRIDDKLASMNGPAPFLHRVREYDGPGDYLRFSRGMWDLVRMTDEQTQRIADDAKIDPANFAIFINGYALCRKSLSMPK